MWITQVYRWSVDDEPHAGLKLRILHFSLSKQKLALISQGDRKGAREHEPIPKISYCFFKSSAVVWNFLITSAFLAYVCPRHRHA
ncbi:hypothetical protein CWB99_18155 [Pseudoalteromonas rubra]|uniref:Uncharacterized protein n=1 Tax=Pseudoalteromonas rubra TaxID=43658 RepID=A0A5S3WHC3_9GAMM|nr:hypothetical protein CWB99_18155 [Pseudoalteromonas rubra]TMP35789.1 hypothetical protein CWC00_03665 [Pseudoalteromonas rubra]